ncbi:MAG: cation acetate symporter, partial [Caldilineae bacterium]
NEIIIDRDIIVLSTPEVAKLAPWVVGLVAAGGLAAALSTAAGLLLAMSSAFSHDIYFRVLRPGASESQRLLVGRATIFVAILIAGYFGVKPPGFVGEVVAFAFGLAAASLFPAILLGIFDRRMNREGAIVGILTGLIFTMVMIILIRSDRLLGTEGPILQSFLGVNAQGVGVYGAILNFIISYVVSRATPPPPEEIQHLVEDIRVPRGTREAVAAH